MRLLLFLPWLLAASLVKADTPPDCNWKMPPAGVAVCTQIIRWRHRSEKEATSTCLEYFPTTFVKGESNDANKHEIKCTVYRQYECNHIEGSFSMYDKCYKFTKKDKTMDEYVTEGHKFKTEASGKITFDLCGADGALPIFFTMSQGKQIAMEAHRQKIEKIWVNLDKDGKTIDEPTNAKSKIIPKGFLLYKDLWKVHEDVYWNGDEVKTMPKDAMLKPIVPAEAKFLFFRSRTDHIYNLIQGSFERATKDTKASVVCEYPAKIVPDVELYCDKLGPNGLGLNAMYDGTNGRKRCVYTSLSKYSLKGTSADIKAFPGCREAPSFEHSAGLDDGTARKDVYDKLTELAKYRVAAIKIKSDITGASATNYDTDKRTKGDGKTANENHRRVYRIYDHRGEKEEYSSKMTSPWETNYPMNEKSDFPDGDVGDSNTLAIRKKMIIDLPVPILAHALCSIEANVDCELNEQACKLKDNKGNDRKNLICKNVNTWNAETKLYAQCQCAAGHVADNNDCKWEGADNSCGSIQSDSDPKFVEVEKANWFNLQQADGPGKKFYKFHDHVCAARVRNGCTMTIWSHPNPVDQKYPLLNNKPYGEYVVPNTKLGTLNGWGEGMSASAITCECP